ncbi:MAG: ABC transporter permease [Deinococcales bacterium]
MTGLTQVLNLQLLFDVLRMTTPILLLALGAMITDRGGVLNIALEGLVLFGAFTAVLGTGVTGNLLVGVLCGILGGLLLSLAFGWFSLYLRGNIFIVGLATNAFASAVTTYAAWLVSGREGSLQFQGSPTLGAVNIPLLHDVPFLSFLNGHTVIDYVAWVLVVAVSIIVFRTRFGLRLRAVGEDPEAARAAGIEVRRIQFVAVAASGLLAGLAGAQLSLTLGGFVQDMSAGRGWIGLVASIVGNGTAWGSAAASVLFGAAEGIANSLQITAKQVPTQLLFALPYVITLVALVFGSATRRGRGDALDG